MQVWLLYIFCCIFSLSLTTLLMLVRNVLLLLVVARMDKLKRCRSHSEKLLLSMRRKDMSDSLDRGKKGKKKRKKNPPHLLDIGSPQLISDLGDSTSYREEPIHIEFSAKEPSSADRRFADVIRREEAVA